MRTRELKGFGYDSGTGKDPPVGWGEPKAETLRPNGWNLEVMAYAYGWALLP